MSAHGEPYERNVPRVRAGRRPEQPVRLRGWLRRRGRHCCHPRASVGPRQRHGLPHRRGRPRGRRRMRHAWHRCGRRWWAHAAAGVCKRGELAASACQRRRRAEPAKRRVHERRRGNHLLRGGRLLSHGRPVDVCAGGVDGDARDSGGEYLGLGGTEQRRGLGGQRRRATRVPNRHDDAHQRRAAPVSDQVRRSDAARARLSAHERELLPPVPQHRGGQAQPAQLLVDCRRLAG